MDLVQIYMGNSVVFTSYTDREGERKEPKERESKGASLHFTHK